MKDAPEIAPEIRGLLEELVADPRSSIRLAPRRALSHWFDSDERVSAREISGTKLERHLIEAHREELAQLLFEASRIAYWKAPKFTVPLLDTEGRPIDSARMEAAWRPRATRSSAFDADGVDTLRSVLSDVASADGFRLAAASLSLVPNDDARFALAQCVPENEPRTALRMLVRLDASSAGTSIHGSVVKHRALRTCSTHGLAHAKETYRRTLDSQPCCVVTWVSILNLSCFLRDREEGVAAAKRLDELECPRSDRFRQAKFALSQWIATRPRSEVDAAMQVMRDVARGSESADSLCEAFAR